MREGQQCKKEEKREEEEEKGEGGGLLGPFYYFKVRSVGHFVCQDRMKSIRWCFCSRL